MLLEMRLNTVLLKPNIANDSSIVNTNDNECELEVTQRIN